MSMPYKVIPAAYHCQNWLCRAWGHWLNPFGNWHEPTPYPEKRKIQARDHWLPDGLWWALRNPFHNFCHFWIGLVPLGRRYEWHSPEENGWHRSEGRHLNWWVKPWRIPLPYFKIEGGWTFYIGWMSRGSFGMALRRN